MTNTDADFDQALARHFPPRRHEDRPLYAGLHRVSLGDRYEPQLYAPLRGFVSPGTPACITNACGQRGGTACPTPDACRIPDEDNVGRDARFPEGAGFVVSLAIVAGIVACVLALSYVVRL